MRVLVVHNRYRSEMPSGENRVVDDEVEMLREAGVEVDTYIRSSDEIENFGSRQKLGLAVRPILSLEDAALFRQRLAEFQPDVVHVHNPFPLISPHIIKVAKRAGVPAVQTVHNYRHTCPAGTFFRDGQVCEECSGKRVPWPAVVHGCYRDSHMESAVMAAASFAHRSTWQLLDHFLPVSDYVAGHLVRAGMPHHKVTVKHNPVADPGAPTPPGAGVLFAGRLSAEKGISLLLDAWRLVPPDCPLTLTIAGDGPEVDGVRALESQDPRLRYVGRLDREALHAAMRGSASVVVPSTCYEGAPMVVAEAFAHGRAVIGTAVGALPSVVPQDAGWLVDPEPEALARAIGFVADASVVRAKGEAARGTYLATSAPSAVTEALLSIYGHCIPGAKSALPPASTAGLHG